MYFTSNLDYATKYTKDKVVILSLLILGNSFPITEHPLATDQNGNLILEMKQIQNGREIKQQMVPKANPLGFYAKPLQPGYQSHFTLGNFFFSKQII